ncbi:MAG: HD domain-containing protein [Desulfobacterales bacterium]|jgi:tRNA nucleotidyltransferase/poly(A) polymerase|nr:HD domain-containing protein [Desulfobacterales bacterium]
MTKLNDKLLPLTIRTGLTGTSAYIVGGSARDLFLGRQPTDYDITVFENPEEFARQLAGKTKGRLVTMGKPGKTTYRVVSGAHVVDVTPPRGNTIEADLECRDFTMNAMAFDLAFGRLIDPLGGRLDIKKKQIRVASRTAFQDDPIRLLRAYRMAASFGFSIVPATRTLLTESSHLITRSASERVREEIFKILSATHAHPIIQQMRESGLLFAVFPELSPLDGCTQNRHHSHDVLDHTLAALAHLESLLTEDTPTLPALPEPPDPMRIIWLKFALLLHDIGKPACRSVDALGDIHFYGHETAGAKAAQCICKRLRCANTAQNFITAIIARHVRPLHLYQAFQKQTLTDKAITCFFMTCGDDTPYLLWHVAADLFGKGAASHSTLAPFTAFLCMLLNRFFTEFKIKSSSPPLLTGKDLIAEFGLPPSALFKHILARVETARLSGTCTTRNAAISLVRDYLSAQSTSNKI